MLVEVDHQARPFHCWYGHGGVADVPIAIAAGGAVGVVNDKALRFAARVRRLLGVVGYAADDCGAAADILSVVAVAVEVVSVASELLRAVEEFAADHQAGGAGLVLPAPYRSEGGVGLAALGDRLCFEAGFEAFEVGAGDEVDDASDGVGAIEGGAAVLEHFDAVDHVDGDLVDIDKAVAVVEFLAGVGHAFAVEHHQCGSWPEAAQCDVGQAAAGAGGESAGIGGGGV